MIRIVLILALSIFLAAPGLSAAESFQAPVPDGGKLLTPEDSGTVNLLYREVTLKEIIGFYRDNLKDKENINWKETANLRGIVIHDWGNREWHKIEVAEDTESGVQITINRDSWTWVLGTLVIRFVGVFTVLVILMITLYISGFIMTFEFRKTDSEKA
jgi:hypothetical protein